MRRTVGIIVAIVCLAASGNAHADEVRVDPIYPDPIVVAQERWKPRMLNDRGQMVASHSISGTDLVFDPVRGAVPLSDLDIHTADVKDLSDAGVAIVAQQGGIPLAIDLATMAVTRLPSHGVPLAISETGVIVGTWSGQALAWATTTTEPVVLEDFGSEAVATDVNENGIAVGVLDDATGRRPVAWDLTTGAVRDLSAEIGLIFGWNLSINDRNEVLVPLGSRRSWNVTDDAGNYVTIDLDTDVVTEISRNDESSVAPVLNERGEVAWLRRGGPSTYSSEAAVIVDLELQSTREVALPEGDARDPFSFNDRGQLAVNVIIDGVQRPHLWDPLHGWTDLGAGDGRGLIVGTTNDVGEAAGVDGDGRPWVASVRYAPLEPHNARAIVIGSSVALAWERPLAEGDAPVDLYRVYRNGTLVVETPDLRAVDEAVDEGTSRQVGYTVSAVNAFGESDPSEPVMVTVGSAAADQPAAVGGPVATAPSVAAAAASGVPRFTG